MAKKNDIINPTMKEKLTQLDLSASTFQSGGIYLTNDQKVLFPTRNKNKVVDKPRMVVVLGKVEHLNDPLIPTVHAIPITTVPDETPQCLPVKSGTGNLHEDSLIKAGLLQPILKKNLGNQIGVLDPKSCRELKATVFVNLGLDEDDEEENSSEVADNEAKD